MTEVIETEWIPMPDGIRLAARLWLPDEAARSPVPCILEYIPYRRRDRTRMRDESMHPHFADAGYAAVRVDMRGSGDSEGVMLDEYSEQEMADGVDVIAWIAEQPWCDGNVGMFGKSWGAYTSFQVAAKRPPALKAIAPVMGTDDRWLEDIHFYGGVLANDNFWWGSIMQLYNAMPPDPAIVGEDRWRDMWRERLEAMTFWPAQWLEHQTHDEMWRRGSISENYADVEIPVYFFGGWADLFRDTPFRIAERLKGPIKVLMGPWAHLYPHEGLPRPRMDFVNEVIRFWDHCLKGIDTGLMDEPHLRFYLQDSAPPAGSRKERTGVWVEEAAWPSPNVSIETLWLNEGRLGTSAESGDTMSVCSPQTFGSAGGDMCSFAIPGDMP
ncbi:MAG: CocE/NonD family hydrolase, partial [Boseongicola sp.]|nr:CocE/NonD family hydrolase [Boseongicola sp.]